MDNHGSHCTREFLCYCDDYKIVLFACLPYTTHLVQPLDVVVFQPYKHYHRDAIARATRTGYGEFSKIEFLAAIESIRN
jgi:DDE superfamily endonuclease